MDGKEGPANDLGLLIMSVERSYEIVAGVVFLAFLEIVQSLHSWVD